MIDDDGMGNLITRNGVGKFNRLALRFASHCASLFNHFVLDHFSEERSIGPVTNGDGIPYNVNTKRVVVVNLPHCQVK